jgi:hypothetical protein
MDLAIEQHRPRSTRMSFLIGRLDRTPAFLHSTSTQTMVRDSPGKLRWFAQRSVPSTPKPALRAMNDRPPAGVRAASRSASRNGGDPLRRRLDPGRGFRGRLWNCVFLGGRDAARRGWPDRVARGVPSVQRSKMDVTVGLTTSLLALVGPILFFAWLARTTEWGW